MVRMDKGARAVRVTRVSLGQELLSYFREMCLLQRKNESKKAGHCEGGLFRLASRHIT